MKILIHPFMDTNNIDNPCMLANYVVDAVIHGARMLFGENAIDSIRLWYLYKDTYNINLDKIKYLWGKGFSYTGTLDNDDNIDRTDLQRKLESGYFDLIIMPIHHSVNVG